MGKHSAAMFRTVRPVDITSCRRYRSLSGRPHVFAESGWCVYGCGVRSDGAVMSMRSGEWLRRPAGDDAGDDAGDTPQTELRPASRGP